MKFLYGPFIKVFKYIYQTYTTNRNRVENLKEGKTVSSLIRNGAVIILVVWVLIWIFASDESRDRLNREVKESLGSFSSQIEK